MNNLHNFSVSNTIKLQYKAEFDIKYDVGLFTRRKTFGKVI